MTITSKLTNTQLLAVAQQTLNARDFDHVKWYFTRGTADPDFFRQDAIQFITKRAGKTPDQLVDGIVAAQIRREEEAKKPKPNDGGTAVRILDLSKQGQPAAENPNMLVAEACHGGCGLRLALTLGEVQAGAETCWCLNCRPKALLNSAAAEKLLQRFLTNVPSFYLDPKGFNASIMAAEIDRRHLQNPSIGDLIEIYAENRSKMLQRLTPEEVRAMTSSQLDARIIQDPGLGGVDVEACKEGQQHITGAFQAHSTNKTKYLPFRPTGTPRSGQTGGI
jgi:hypothetical protein